MPDKEQQERSLPELVVKEAVGAGMDSPLRETIVEAVDEAEGRPSAARRAPLVVAALGLGAGIGYLLGTRGEELYELGSERIPVEEGESLEDVVEETTEAVASTAESVETEAEVSDGGGRRRLPVIALILAVAAGIAVLRRRFGSEEAEWEPIEEFDVGTGDEEESTEEEEAEETEAEEPSEAEESEEEAEADEGDEESAGEDEGETAET